jgi:hypothetical protein
MKFRMPKFIRLLKEPAVQVYLVGCLLFLGLLVVTQMGRGVPELFALSLVLLVIGFLGMFAQFGSAPALLLLVVGGGELYVRQTLLGRLLRRQGYYQEIGAVEFLLCLSVLGYLICQYRLHALVSNLLPHDPRLRREPTRQHPVPWHRRRQIVQRRSPHGFSPLEVGLFLLTLPLWVLMGFTLWLWLAAPRNVLDLPEELRRMILLVWLIFLLLVLAAIFLENWRWRTQSRDEALLFLQDTYWRETRREQRTQYRWLAWARRYGKFRKKGKP